MIPRTNSVLLSGLLITVYSVVLAHANFALAFRITTFYDEFVASSVSAAEDAIPFSPQRYLVCFSVASAERARFQLTAFHHNPPLDRLSQVLSIPFQKEV